jgi:SAM-dependent methyltransferase
MTEGPNVDIAVKSPYKWNEIRDNYCDVVISGQVFEHIEFPWLTMLEIARVVKPNGLVCIIAPNGLGLHRYPVDCWRFYSDGMIALAKWAGLEIAHVSTNLAPEGVSIEWYGEWQDCMLIAYKPEHPLKADIADYVCSPSDLDTLATGFIPLEKQPWYKIWNLKRVIKRILKVVLYPIFKIKNYKKIRIVR